MNRHLWQTLYRLCEDPIGKYIVNYNNKLYFLGIFLCGNGMVLREKGI